MTQKSDGGGSLPIGAQKVDGALPIGHGEVAVCQECGNAWAHATSCSRYPKHGLANQYQKTGEQAVRDCKPVPEPTEDEKIDDLFDRGEWPPGYEKTGSGVPIAEDAPAKQDRVVVAENLRVLFIDSSVTPTTVMVEMLIDSGLSAYIPQIGDLVTPPGQTTLWRVRSRHIVLNDKPYIAISIRERK